MAFFREVGEDIRNMVEKDPAARNGLEVLICYPGIWALIWHRPAHWLYRHHCPFLARVISQLTRFFTGIEIHPGAIILAHPTAPTLEALPQIIQALQADGYRFVCVSENIGLQAAEGSN